MNKQAYISKTRLLLTISLVLLLGLGACQSPKVDVPLNGDVPFETVLKGNIPSSYDTMDLMVATNSTEAQQVVDTLQPHRSDGDLEEITKVNYEEYLVIAAILGVWGYGGAEITVERVSQVGQNVKVVISTVEPTFGDRVIVHPVHVIKIKRADLPVQGQVKFSLYKGDELVLTREHFIP